jgi:hypothetical protein
VDFFLLRRAALLAFFDPEAGLVDSGFAACGGAAGTCEAGSVACDAGGWEVCVSVLCAACGGEAVLDKNVNKMKIAARVIPDFRAVKSYYAFVGNVTYELAARLRLTSSVRCGGIRLVLRITLR